MRPHRRDLLRAALLSPLLTTAVRAAGEDKLAGARAMLAQDGVSLVAGMIDGESRRIVPAGALDGDTVFDIGSLTKIFTALLLADMTQAGLVAMTDPLAKYLPANLHVPAFKGQPITLLDLVTYVPGLPGWPGNIPALDPAKPFPDYSESQILAALESQTLTAAPGTQYVYSNFGFGLLALALAQAANMPFEALLLSRLCEPLGLTSTRIAPTPAMQMRRIPGHDGAGKTVAGWTLPPALAGAGALRSSANDLMRFLESAMGLRRTKLAPAFARLLAIQHPADRPDTRAAAGWFVTDDAIVWKDGAVPGFTSFLGYNMKEKRGLVLLADGHAGAMLTPLGKTLLA